MDPTDSYGDTDEDAYVGGFMYDFDKYGFFDLKFTRRDRRNTWVMLLTPGDIEENSEDWNLKYVLERDLGIHKNKLTLGYDFRHSKYMQHTSFAVKPYKVDNRGYYGLNEFTFNDRFVFRGGYRYHEYKANREGRTWKDWPLDAWSTGAVYLHKYGSFFLNYATSFRYPDVDELGFATDDIRYQEGKHFDAGVRFLWKRNLEFTLTYFWVRIEDEIWFDAMNYINTNYDDPTLRRGVELYFKAYPVKEVMFWVNYTYCKAEFENIDFKVPAVPEHKFSMGATWDLYRWWKLAVTYNFVGERPQGGDLLLASTYDYMPSYQLWDFKTTFNVEKYNLKIYFACTNILDRKYYTLEYYDNVYPGAGRWGTGGVEWSF